MKKWFWGRWLPLWAKQTLMQDLAAREKENAALKEKLRQQEAYIRGLLRGSKRIIIQGGKQWTS